MHTQFCLYLHSIITTTQKFPSIRHDHRPEAEHNNGTSGQHPQLVEINVQYCLTDLLSKGAL